MGVHIVPDFDEDGRQIVRQAITKSGWAMHNVFIEITTSTFSNAIKDYKKDLSSRNIATCKFYDSNDVELTTDQAQLDANCVKTVMEVNFPFDLELQGGRFYAPNISTDVYMHVQVAPHIPSADGGSVEFISGVNLNLVKEFIIDGRAPKLISDDNTYLSDKWEFTFNHNTGAKEKIMVCYEAYKDPTSTY